MKLRFLRKILVIIGEPSHERVLFHLSGSMGLAEKENLLHRTKYMAIYNFFMVRRFVQLLCRKDLLIKPNLEIYALLFKRQEG